jgi:transcriptional regulator with XRE-family HTH domain
MKKKKSLGELLRIRREALGLSQRQLGRRAGVTASHIAYIESGRRRPSYSLLFRIGQGMNLGYKDLFLLAYPEAAMLFSPLTGSQKRQDGWERFIAVSRRYSVTPTEVEVMRKISRLGKISSSRSYLSILNSIRQSIVPD